jgi:hypothetical protein
LRSSCNISMMLLVYLVIMLRFPILMLLCVLAFAPLTAFSQTPEEFEANYAKRIKEEMLFGVYIPVDLNDAHAELSRLADQEGLIAFKSAPEDSIRRKLHFGFGRWIMTNWGLEEGSRISHYLKTQGVSRPDDMVRLIIVTWHRKLNGRPLEIEKELGAIKVSMDAEKAKRDQDKKVIILEKRPHKE